MASTIATTPITCTEDPSCVLLQHSFRPTANQQNIPTISSLNAAASGLLSKLQMSVSKTKTEYYEKVSLSIFVLFCLFAIACISYVLGVDSTSTPIDVHFQSWPILSGLFMIFVFWVYFFFEMYSSLDISKDFKEPGTLFYLFKKWSRENTSSIISNIWQRLHRDYDYKGIDASGGQPNSFYSFLDTFPKLYFFYSFKTIAISVAVILYIYYCLKGTWYQTAGGAILLLIYLWFLTDFYFMCDTFAQYSNPQEKVDNKEHIFSKLNIFFLLFNISIIIFTSVVFIRNLFPGSRITGWADMTAAFGVVIVMFTIAKGETLGEKYTYLMSQTNTYWKHLPTLTFYVLFFVAFLMMKQPLPSFLMNIVQQMTANERDAWNNIYIYGIFPVFIYVGCKLFYDAIHDELKLEKGIDYNVIRIRYTVIYFLLVVFVCTLIFNKSSVPCYLQYIFNFSNTTTKSIMIVIVGLMISGLLFVMSVLTSPNKFTTELQDASKLDTTTTSTTTEITKVSNNKILLPVKMGTLIRLSVCISFIIVIILIRYLSNSIAVFSTAKFFVFVIILIVLFLVLCIGELFNTEASSSDDSNISTILRNFAMFASGAAFTCFAIAFVYIEFVQKAPDSGYVFYNLFLLVFYVLYQILASSDVVQNNQTYRQIVETIFIIPCYFETHILPMMIGKTGYDKYIEFRYNHPYYLYTIFIVLILLIILCQRLIYNKITDQKNSLGGFILYNDPINTNIQTSASINNINVLMQEFIPPQTYSDTSFNSGISTTFIYNYSVGFWFFIENTQNSDGALLNFASNPLVFYQNQNNSMTISFTVSSSNDTMEVVIPNIKIQKWNYVLINVDNGFADIFLNGTLTSTIENMIPYFNAATPSITIGEQNGTFGQVCNLNYYPRPLKLIEISTIYTTYSSSNPPSNTYSSEATRLQNSKYERHLRSTEKRIIDIQKNITCGYKSMFDVPDACNNTVDMTPPLHDDYISLKWFFEQMGDYTNGL